MDGELRSLFDMENGRLIYAALAISLIAGLYRTSWQTEITHRQSDN